MIHADPISNNLLSPCGGSYLHLVEVEWLDGPEDKDGVSLVLKDRQATIRAAKRSEIPGRRDCLLLTFRCETCDADHVLQLKQHKGNTEATWA